MNRNFDHRKLKGTDHVGDLDFGMRIILKKPVPVAARSKA